MLTRQRGGPVPTSADVLALETDGRSAQLAWSSLASLVRDFASPYDALDPHLAAAAGEVRACTATWSSRDVAPGADDADIVRGRGVSEGPAAALRAAAEVAVIVGDEVSSGALTGPARVLSRRAQDLMGTDAGGADRDVIWVSPTDILREARIAAPGPVADALVAASTALCASTRSAVYSAVSTTEGVDDAARLRVSFGVGSSMHPIEPERSPPPVR